MNVTCPLTTNFIDSVQTFWIEKEQWHGDIFFFSESRTIMQETKLTEQRQGETNQSANLTINLKCNYCSCEPDSKSFLVDAER